MKWMESCDHSLNGSAHGPACQAAIEFGIDPRELDYLLGLSPLERLVRHDQALQLIIAAQEAGVQHYGVDPRPAEDPDKS
jgi:hypothetical protein